jgi:ATP-dependent Clp protease adaptor protein ClpS
MGVTWTETEEDLDVLVDDDEGKSLVVHNDEVNTFDWVIECLMEVCRHERLQAEQCTVLIHHKGKCSVKNGSYEKLEPMKDALHVRGLSATIE